MPRRKVPQWLKDQRSQKPRKPTLLQDLKDLHTEVGEQMTGWKPEILPPLDLHPVKVAEKSKLEEFTEIISIMMRRFL